MEKAQKQQITLIFTHRYCNDGFAARMLALNYYLDALKSVEPADDPRYELSEYNGIITIKMPNSIIKLIETYPKKLADSLEWFIKNTYEFNNHTQEIAEILSFDVSIMPKELEYACNITQRVKIFDHHDSTFKAFACTGNLCNKLILDKVKSGARLAYDYFYPNCQSAIPEIIQYIQARDTFNFNLECNINGNVFAQSLTRIICDGIYSILSPTNNKIDEWRNALNPNSQLEFINRALVVGEVISKDKDIAIKRAINNGKLYVVDSNNFNKFGIDKHKNTNLSCSIFMVNSCLHQSDIGDYLLDDGQTKNDYVIIWYYNSRDESYVCSLRSREYDCTLIAEKFGGGGHKCAAAFSMKNPPMSLFE